jgi:CoA:oxalate CoA-transferase
VSDMRVDLVSDVNNPGPLEGIRVIDLTRALAGPFATLILAGLGADVIKVEDPNGGDIARGNAPYVGPGGLTLRPSDPDDLSLALLTRCRGKRSVTLNLKVPEAREVFFDLVRSADVVVENFSSGTADRLGVGYAAAQQANPKIVYCSISGFGSRTDAGVRAMDTIIQALSGVMLSGGAEGDAPFRVGVPMADVLTPVWAVVGILAALQRRQRSDDLASRDRGLGGTRAARPAHPNGSHAATACTFRLVPLQGGMGCDRRSPGPYGQEPV